MKITGIIAEYNPFHQGHKYQIETLRKQYQSDYIVVAMSGDFVQRGTPALVSKYQRAQMALTQGADLVLELPALFATSSAEAFARGGILLLHTTGIVDSVCFGAETCDLPQLQTLAGILQEEPEWYRNALLSYMKKGDSFPVARAKALPKYATLLESPNNILAVEYLKSLQHLGLSMEPHLIQRIGSNYHNTNITSPTASASAIRHDLFQHGYISQEVQHALPDTSYEIMTGYQDFAAFLNENDFSLLLHHALLRETAESLLRYADMTPSIANRIMELRNSFLSWSDFCEKCKTRNVTYTRISRILTHILLNITQDTLATLMSESRLPYLRILGLRQEASALLNVLKEHTLAPIITSVSNGERLLQKEQLSALGLSLLHTDIYASDLYRSVLTHICQKTYPNEYQRKLLTV